MTRASCRNVSKFTEQLSCPKRIFVCFYATVNIISHALIKSPPGVHVQAIEGTGVGYVDYAIGFSRTDDNLKVNLDNLLIQLRAQVCPFWYQFGEAAGIETEILDKLADNYSPQECIVEMFDYWLRKQNKLPTWRDIAKILKVINLEQLAAEIEVVYTTGKLNTNEVSQELETKFEASESPPPIPPKRMEANYSGRGYDHSNSTEPKNTEPPPPLPEALPILPPKIKMDVANASVPARPPKL